jgi:branched-chain amino acid transport system substrate-binding protein
MRLRRGSPWLVLTVVSALVALAMFAPACAGSTPGAGGRSVRIGLGAPLTGPAAFDGQMIRDGAQLATDLGKERVAGLELVVEDDKSDPKEGAAIANKFAGDTDLVAVVGHYNSSVTLAAAPVLGKTGIVQISPGSSSPKITGYSKWLFRTQPTDKTVGENIVRWAIDNGHRRAAVIYEDTDFGKGLEHIYAENWPGEGREIVLTESYLSGKTTDFTAILTKLRNAGADVVLLGALYNEAALIGKQARQLGVSLPFYGDTSQATQAFIDLGGDAIEGWRVVGASDPNSADPGVQKFVQAFRDRFGKEPNGFAAQSYDATSILIEAVARHGPDRNKVQEFVSSTRG